MKEIHVRDAVGMALCHDITQIIRGGVKDARFRRGHVITEEDVPVLLSLGKEHIFVWEENENMLHENDAAAILADLCQGDNMKRGDVKEGKIELIATVDGVLRIDVEHIDALNDLEDMCVATISNNMPVKAGQKLAGMRVVPLTIDREKMEEAKRSAGSTPLLQVVPYKKFKVGVVTTGSEVAHGLIKDTFTPVIAAKLKPFGLQIDGHRLSDDVNEHTLAAIEELLAEGMDMILCTGGMSVDPDDRTPAAIRATGAKIVTYGTPVLPGAMFLLSYLERGGKTITVLGLPGCVMHDPATIFDIVLPRLVAGIPLSRRDIRGLGVGGFCMRCKVCHYPICPFGK